MGMRLGWWEGIVEISVWKVGKVYIVKVWGYIMP